MKYFNSTTNCLKYFVNSYNSDISVISFLLFNCNFFKMESFFNFQDSMIDLSNITFKNSYFGDSMTFMLIRKISKNLNNKINLIILKDSSFYNITSSSNAEFDLIFLDTYSIDFKLNNCSFKNISFLGKIINTDNFLNSLVMKNCNFANNEVRNNLFVKSCQYFLLENTTCKNNNIVQQNKKYGEACFFIKNTFYRELKKTAIINSFSKSTAAGIIFWDEYIFTQQYLKRNVIFIADSNFVKLYSSFSKYNKFEGAAINIISRSSLFVINCKFLINEVEIKNNAAFSIGGPCLTSYWNTIAFIMNSYFKRNRSIKLSNCLIIYSKSLFVDKSIFYNNTLLSFTDEMFKSKRKFRWRLDSLSSLDEINFSSNSKGGALMFSGNYLIVNNSYFWENKANYGSGIASNEVFLNENVQIIIVSNSHFFRQDSISSSIFYLSPLKKNLFFFLSSNTVFDNNAFDGNAITLFVNSNSSIFALNNTFGYNIANIGGIFYDTVGNGRFFLLNNFYYENKLAAYLIDSGSGGVILTSLQKSFCLSAFERYYKNKGADGLFAIFSSYFSEYKSIYVENFSLISIFASLSFSEFLQKGSYLLNNIVNKLACYTMRDNASLKMEGCIIKNCTSLIRDVGSTMQLNFNIRSLIVNCIFINNSFQKENSIEISSNIYENNFLNCYFVEHNVQKSIFLIFESNYSLINSTFIKNNGSNFDFILCDLFLNNIFVLFQRTIQNKPLFEIEDCQAVLIINIHLFKVEVKLSLFEIENSRVSVENIKLTDIISSTLSYLFKIKNGVFRLNLAQFKTSESNILYLKNLNFTLSNSFFFFENHLTSSNFDSFGAIYIRDSSFIVLNKSIFFNFSKKALGGALTCINKRNNGMNVLLLTENYFHSNVAEKGGALYLSKFGCFVLRTIFKLNKANYGGSIFFHSESNFN